MDLFERPIGEKEKATKNEPLAVRMRPRTLEEFFGQAHILGDSGLLRRLIESDRIASVILYGPPGCGKTTLALIISERTKSHFERINAASNNVADMRRIRCSVRNSRIDPATLPMKVATNSPININQSRFQSPVTSTLSISVPM